MLHSGHTTGLKEHDGLSVKLMLAVSSCHRRFSTFPNISCRGYSCRCARSDGFGFLRWSSASFESRKVFEDVQMTSTVISASQFAPSDVKKVNNEEPQLCLLCGVRAPQRTGPHCWGSDETFVQIQAEMELLSILTSVKQHNLISRKEKKGVGIRFQLSLIWFGENEESKGSKSAPREQTGWTSAEEHQRERTTFFFFFLHFWIINRDQFQEDVTVRCSILLCYGQVITSADMMAMEAGRRQRGLSRWANNNPLMSSHSGHFQIN